MKILLNIDEALSIAIQMESNAAGFYRSAAGLQADKTIAAFLERLAAMENGHKQTFITLRSRISVKTAQSPEEELDPEGALFLSAIASGCRVEGSTTVTEALTGGETLEDILATGIELEKQAVLFYLGLQDLFPSLSHRTIIQDIIEEEKTHITALVEKRSELASSNNPA
jgi:rubrerythrin